MSIKSQIFCAWCGVLCPLVMFAGLILAGFLPPLLPSASANEIATIYQQNRVGIRLGMIVMLISGGLYTPFVAAISDQMRRIEGSGTRVLTYLQLASGAAVALFFIIPPMIWTTAAFRPDRSPEITQALNDLGWLLLVVPFTLPFVENLSIGFAIISDKKTNPIFPRWLGFFNVWIALLFIPACPAVFFMAGPFAWNGSVAFWLPAGVLGPWFFVMAIYLIKAAKQQYRDANLASQ